MTGYQFLLRCAWCHAELRHINDGVTTGTESTAVARCDACRRDYVVTVYVTPVEDPERRRARERKRASRLVGVAG